MFSIASTRFRRRPSPRSVRRSCYLAACVSVGLKIAEAVEHGKAWVERGDAAKMSSARKEERDKMGAKGLGVPRRAMPQTGKPLQRVSREEKKPTTKRSCLAKVYPQAVVGKSEALHTR